MNGISSQPELLGRDYLRRKVRHLGLLLLASGLMCTGCASFQTGTNGYMDRFFCGWRDHVWAKRAYRLRYPACHCAHPTHFQKGFVAGYSAICNGEDGYVPAMPPRNYWGFAYQSASGEEMINAWFEGYPEGVRAAQQDGAGQFRDVQYSRMIDQAMSQEQSGWDQAELARSIDYVEPLPTEASPLAAPQALEGQPLPVYDDTGAGAPPAITVPALPETTSNAEPSTEGSENESVYPSPQVLPGVMQTNTPLPLGASRWRGN